MFHQNFVSCNTCSVGIVLCEACCIFDHVLGVLDVHFSAPTTEAFSGALWPYPSESTFTVGLWSFVPAVGAVSSGEALGSGGVAAIGASILFVRFCSILIVVGRFFIYIRKCFARTKDPAKTWTKKRSRAHSKLRKLITLNVWFVF